jgi:hypothetical protein
LIAGPKHIVQDIEKKLLIYFDSKFNLPKDFLGLDLKKHDIEKGLIQLSMSTFTNKVKETFKVPDSLPIQTPGRTDRKIIRGQDTQPDETYRSKVGSLMWATMGIRYDIVYAVKELSRVLQEPTKIAHEILDKPSPTLPKPIKHTSYSTMQRWHPTLYPQQERNPTNKKTYMT